MTSLDIIIPAYNEEKILRANVTTLLAYLREHPLTVSWTITLSINGSPDRSAEIAAALARENPGVVRALILHERGKGIAITRAALQSTADIIFFMDSDLAVDLANMTDLLAPLLSGEADLVIASRLLPESVTERSLLRTLSSRVYNLLSRLVLWHSLSDLQCGFKAGTRALFQEMLLQVHDRRWFFDTELVTLALASGKRVREIPVSWNENRYDARASKLHLIRDSLRFLVKLVQLRWRLWRPRRARVWRHRAAVLIALLIGVLYAGPHIIFMTTPGYQGIYMSEASDEDFYMTTIEKSSVGAPVGNPYLFEYQTVRNPFQYYAVERVLGWVRGLLQMPVDIFAIVMKFLFPALLTLIVYAGAFLLCRSRVSAVLASAAVLLGEELARPSITDLLATLRFESPFTHYMLYARPVNPQVSSLFFFAALIAFFLLFRRPTSRRAQVVAAVSIGVLAYVYFYFWVFVCVLVGVMGAYALVSRAWPLVRGALIALVGGLVLSLPFLLALFSALSGDAGMLSQAVPSHAPIIEKVVLLPLGLFMLVALYQWLRSRRRQSARALFEPSYLFVGMLLLTGVLVSNQQVLTGKLVQQHHFHFFTNIPLLLFASALAVGEVSRRWGTTLRRVSIGALLLLLLWHATGVQVSSYNAHYAEYTRLQSLMPIVVWLDTHAPREAIVLEDQSASTRITMYTPVYLYSSAYDSTYVVPRERLEHNYFVQLALRGVTEKTVRAYVYDPVHRAEIGGLLYAGAYWRDFCGSYGCFPDRELEQLITAYTGFSRHTLAENIARYPVTYLLADNMTEPHWNLTHLHLTPVASSSAYTLYAFP